jgi:uncharacterized membrane protein
MQRKVVGVIVLAAVLASLASLFVGPAPGTRFGYQIMTAHSAALSWLVICILLTVTGVPLVTYILRDELYEYNKYRMRFERFGREERPAMFQFLLWMNLALFLVILAGLFIFSR